MSAVATSGDYDDLTNKPTIPAAQVNSDWNSDSGVSEILNKPTLSAVATSGDYDDLTNKPTIPVNSDFALSGLSDTDITTPTQSGQVLTYDSNGKVVNQPIVSETFTSANANVSIGSRNQIIKQGHWVYISLVITTSAAISSSSNLVKTNSIDLGSTDYVFGGEFNSANYWLEVNGQYIKANQNISSGAIIRITQTIYV